MPALRAIDHNNLSRAFELAFFIIPDKRIALRVVEDAWCSLDVVLGRQERSRKTYRQLLGFVKGEERARPLRTKVKLSSEQMLQWLVYAQSDSWEWATESGDSLYLSGAEDMVVRYVKHLVRITSNRNSFYVALGITRLLYEYGTQEARLIYDILTASDSARMKDMKYLRKQRARLMDEILIRFDGMLQTVTTAHGERRFESQPTNDRLIHLVDECLRQLVPWDTVCAVKEGFDPTAVSGLYFSGTNPADEDRIEMSRIHTILHPDCFARLVNGLSQFVDKLPADSPDKNCKFGAPEKFLAVPQFHNAVHRDLNDDRFDPPKLEPEDYLWLARRRDALERRRRAHVPNSLRIYVDDVERTSFNPRQTTRIHLDLDPGESIIEVRGEDAQGTLPMAILIVGCNDIPVGGSFRDSIEEVGRKVTIELRPIRNVSGDVEGARVEVSYAETGLIQSVFSFAERAWIRVGQKVRPREGFGALNYSWLAKASLILTAIVAGVSLIWFQLRPSQIKEPPPLSGGRLTSEVKPEPSAAPSAAPTPPIQKETPKLIARFTWSRDPESIREAIRLDPERGEPLKVAVPNDQRNLLVALPPTDTESRAYSAYRVAVLAADELIWQQVLRAPMVRPSPPAHVLNLSLASQSQIKSGTLVLRFDGKTLSGWQSLGEVTVELVAP